MTSETHDTTRAAPEHLAADRIVIIADDLTGACDSAVAFASAGWPTSFLLDASASLSETCSGSVTAVSTGTRNLAPIAAASHVSAAIAALRSPSALLFLKIDSAARGNMASEIPAARSASGAALALVTPAFPAAGRTVSSGVLHIRDIAGQDTAIDLRTTFPAAEVISQGSISALEHGIRSAISQGTQILLCDAVTQEDLENLAAAALRIQQPILWAGSSGLARALAASMPTPAIRSMQQIPPRSGRTILFAGTEHPVTARQLDHLRQQNPGSIVHSVDFTAQGQQAILSLFLEFPVASLILTGGDTASFVLRTLGATAIALAGELAPGIPYGRIEGGLADGCTVVTKSGGFGQHDALLRAFHFCERTTLASA